jgi:DHA1 family multidrug resistance protein-like MFS transporter
VPGNSTVGGTHSLFRNREFLALSSASFARAQAGSTILIALALYADLFGTSGVVEGLFGTSFALAQLLAVIPLGRAVDRGDARKYLLAGMVLNVGVFLGFVFVESATQVIFLRLFQGLGAMTLWVTGSTIAGQLGPASERGRWLGAFNQVGAFSSLAGDVIGGYLLYAYGFTLTYVVLAAITVVGFLLVFSFMRREPAGRDDGDASNRERLRELVDRPPLRAMLVFRAFFSMGKMIVLIFLPIYARTSFGVNALAIGGILAGGKLTKSLTQGWVGRFTDRIGGRERFVVIGALVYAAGAAAIPLANSVRGVADPLTIDAMGQTASVTAPMVVLFLAFGLAGIGDSIRLPASMALFVEEGARSESAASSMSLRSMSWKSGELLGPLAAGVLTDAVSPEAGFWLSSVAILASVVAFVLMRRRQTGSLRNIEARSDD